MKNALLIVLIAAVVTTLGCANPPPQEQEKPQPGPLQPSEPIQDTPFIRSQFTVGCVQGLLSNKELVIKEAEALAFCQCYTKKAFDTLTAEEVVVQDREKLNSDRVLMGIRKHCLNLHLAPVKHRIQLD